jgi:CheY-like chemotaxis protein
LDILHNPVDLAHLQDAMAKILLVDDDKELLDTLQEWLSDEGHALGAVHNGIDALEMLAG